MSRSGRSWWGARLRARLRARAPARARDRLAALAAIALLALATWYALREGMAELHAMDANAQISAWESGAPLTRAQFGTAEQALRRAIRLSPRNGDHWESLGTAWFARAVAPGRTLEGRLLSFDQAVNAYREATRRSTVSGYAWSNLMIAKHYAGQIDEEFSVALRNAVRFGPHEAAVQAMIIGAVLPRWMQLDTTARQLAAETVARGWADHRAVLVAEARGAANLELWCDPALWPPEEVAKKAMRRLCGAVAALGPAEPTRAR